MLQVLIGSARFTEVWHDDTPGHGNACHCYQVRMAKDRVAPDDPAPVFASVTFQDGPIGEVGVNGCHHEDLLTMVMHRLQWFQTGEYACQANEDAIGHIQRALHALGLRTLERQERGVEGTSTL